jgi:thiamine biosynthesis lipoprotein
MGTIATIGVVVDASGDECGNSAITAVDTAIDSSFNWFREIERICNRFDPASELRRLSAQAGASTAVSETLYRLVEFAVAVAEETDGAFDPTVGVEMERRGFTHDYRTGSTSASGVGLAPVSYRDIELDPVARTIMLTRPLLLDLGAVAKGFAVDMAAEELRPFRDFAIDAGGDLYLAGHNPSGEAWVAGIRHPRRDDELADTIRVSDRAVCTSGDDVRAGHILDPRRHDVAHVSVSATVIAPTAMLADALATAAFVLGPADGIRLLESHGVDGLILSPSLERFTTRNYVSAILPNA